MTTYNPQASTGNQVQETGYQFDSLNPTLPSKITYPDNSYVQYTYDSAGRKLTMIDQNGTTHTYSYDSAGRLQADVASFASGTSVSEAVQWITYQYDNQGRLQTVATHSTATVDPSVNVVSTVAYGYDWQGNVLSIVQSHDGGTTSVATGYTYNNDGTVASLSCTGAQTIYYNYVSPTGVGSEQLLSISSVANASIGSSSEYTQYSYAGLGTVMQVNHPDVQGDLALKIGLDQLGRVASQAWTVGGQVVNGYYCGGGQTVDGYQYGYDGDSNVLYALNMVNASFSELYHANSPRCVRL